MSGQSRVADHEPYSMMQDLAGYFSSRKQQGLLRVLRPIDSRNEASIVSGGRSLVDFCSNDYLGLSEHPRLKQAISEAVRKWGSASGASRLMSGDLSLHHELEARTARFKGKEAALVLNSGYQANTGLIPALAGPGDAIFLDRLSHASLVDGAKLSGAALHRFEHNSIEHLDVLLQKYRAKAKSAWIVTESVFSMDGDVAPLQDLVERKIKFDCRLMVDEAHATGIFGSTGAGLAEQLDLQAAIDMLMGTFSKSLAGFGAYAACSAELKEYLVNTCRSFIYSTALPPAIIAGNLESLSLVAQEPFRRTAVFDSAESLRAHLRGLGFDVRGVSQIVPVVLGSNERTLKAGQMLEQKGYRVLPVRPPTVPQGQARLRISMTYHHKADLLDKFLDDFQQLDV